jgi:hypothetical protein
VLFPEPTPGFQVVEADVSKFKFPLVTYHCTLLFGEKIEFEESLGDGMEGIVIFALIELSPPPDIVEPVGDILEICIGLFVTAKPFCMEVFLEEVTAEGNVVEDHQDAVGSGKK